MPHDVRRLHVNNVYCREKAQAAVTEAQKDDLILLQDDELVQLFDVTNFKNVHEAQRFNVLVMGFRTGMRPDTLKRLTFDMFKCGTDAEGREWIQAHIGTMKNLPSDLEHLDAAIFKQKIFAHEDPRFAVIS